MRVEVIYALPERTYSVVLNLSKESTASDALSAALNSMEFSELVDLDTRWLSVWGERFDINDDLSDGDRLEILRPLIQNPMDRRRKEAKRFQH